MPKEIKKKVALRLYPSMKEAVEMMSEMEGKSFNMYIENLILEKVRLYKRALEERKQGSNHLN